MPKTTLTITTRPLDWSPRKLADVEGEIIRYFAQMGAPGTTVSYQTEGEEPAKPPEELFLHLCCTECNVEWYAKAFNPCGGCGKRETVAKMEAGRVPLPPVPPLDAPSVVVVPGPEPGMVVEMVDPQAVLTVKTEELPFLVNRATVTETDDIARNLDATMSRITSEQLDAAEMASHERLGEMPTGEISTRPAGQHTAEPDAADLEAAGQALEDPNGGGRADG